ncbi:MAG TPA: transglycosylase SLT domain-containing protein [Longimicrobiales bacterium]|nr:transglycosylase SLT domain-containing protein [Longimicrobiales bacterium]
MSRNALAATLLATTVTVTVVVVLLSRSATTSAAERVEGDVGELLSQLDSDDMPARAEALLATDRPWRAARVMREYLAGRTDAPPEHRLLAARAEAGWGGWSEIPGLLERVPALDTHEDGLGVYLLARARDEAGDAAGAVDGYRAFLALSPPAGERASERAAAQLRLGLALIRSGSRDAGRRELAVAGGLAGGARAWLELLEADALAVTGDTAAVRQTVAGHTDGIPGLRAWRARIEAARYAGDIAAARALANQARAWARTDATRSEFLVTAARAAQDMGDRSAARAALRGVVDRGAAGPHARTAAELLREGEMSPADHLAVARVYRAQGLHEESLDGYRRWLAARTGTAAERNAVHLEHANALFYAHRYDDVADALRPIASQTSARFLHARAEAHRDNPDDAVRIYLGIANQFPRTGTAAQALYLAASARHDAGDAAAARTLYRRVVAEHAGSSQMGLSIMRLASIAFVDGDYAEAARLWDDYRVRYPRGASVLQATYWSGRARAAMGDSAGAAGLYRTVLQRDRESYYALLASEALGQPYWPLPMVAPPGNSPAAEQRVAGLIQGIDMLRAAGFHDEASAEADRVVAAAGRDRFVLYALAEALAERGYAQRAIRIGLQLQRTEQPNRRLLRILYPFPYRTLITEEARDRGVDPFVAAALIRQESMFEARITSPAGARGLMQVMPGTGGRLAEAAGIDGWDAELLYHPEINVHLGTRYVAQHMESYDGSLPAVFSAYNAGAHRVAWWSQWPEYGNAPLFTERIPFAETRNYVRILTRNLAVYRGLYGDG